jgi:hypothetical protein
MEESKHQIVRVGEGERERTGTFTEAHQSDILSQFIPSIIKFASSHRPHDPVFPARWTFLETYIPGNKIKEKS